MTATSMNIIPAPTPVAPAGPAPQAADSGLSWRWLAGWGGAWIILAGMAETEAGELAAGLALLIAGGLTYKLLPGIAGDLKGVF